MTNSIEEFQDADCIFVIGSNTTEAHPVIAVEIKRAAAAGKRLVVADPRQIDLTRHADLYLRQRPGTDAALIGGMIRYIFDNGLHNAEFIEARTEGFEEMAEVLEEATLERTEEITGVPAGDIARAARWFAEAPRASIVYAMGITQHVAGTDNVKALANLAMVTGHIGRRGTGVNPLRGQNNVQGACDLGGLPNVLTGYQKVDVPELRQKFEKAWGVALPDAPGLTLTLAMEKAHAGELKAFYVMGEDPVLSDPHQAHILEALDNLELLVVQDIFLTETAKRAHVVLPAACFAEKEGTVTNTERRVQRSRKVVDPPGEARPDSDILCDLARRMGYSMSYTSAEEVFEEITALTPSYGGMSYGRLENGGLQWPCPAPDHPGTPFLHKGSFARGKGKFHPVRYNPSPELPDGEYPFFLTTGRQLYHFHTGNMSRHSQGLAEREPEGYVEVHPEDAARLGVADGEAVVVTSRRGRVEVPARISDRPDPGVVFMTFHFKEAAANVLTIDALDPVARIPELKVCAVRVEKA
jgi:formate dehydrogenase alpha subunit